MRKPYRPIITHFRLLDRKGNLLSDTYHTVRTCSALTRSKREMRTSQSSVPPGEKCDECIAKEKRRAAK